MKARKKIRFMHRLPGYNDISGETSDFNPLPSARGDRLNGSPFWPLEFQSTPLCEGRRYPASHRAHTPISIHSPLRGETVAPAPIAVCKSFQSTPLCEGRRSTMRLTLSAFYFNPLPSARGDASTSGNALHF